MGQDGCEGELVWQWIVQGEQVISLLIVVIDEQKECLINRHVDFEEVLDMEEVVLEDNYKICEAAESILVGEDRQAVADFVENKAELEG